MRRGQKQNRSLLLFAELRAEGSHQKDPRWCQLRRSYHEDSGKAGQSFSASLCRFISLSVCCVSLLSVSASLCLIYSPLTDTLLCVGHAGMSVFHFSAESSLFLFVLFCLPLFKIRFSALLGVSDTATIGGV